MAREPDDYALLVGVEHYPDYPRFNGLTGPFKDVGGFEAWLLDDAEGGGLDDEHCTAILSSSDPKRPIHDDVEDALDGLFKQARENGGGRRLYVYFSGHGLASDVFGADLCLVKWSLNRRNYAVSTEAYKKYMGETGLFREIVLLLDCCRTRKVQARGHPPTLQGPAPGPHAGETRFFSAYATEFTNAAHEAQTADDDAPEVGDVRGYFTRALLRALWGDAASGDGGVTATSLKDYLEAETPRLAETDGKKQVPQVDNGLPGGDHPAIFGRAVRGKPETTIEFKPEREGLIVLHGPHGELKRGQASTGPWRLPLEAGALHLLLDEGAGDQHPFWPSGEEGGDHVAF